MTRFELHILGCGSATCTLRHQPSCQVLNVRDNLLMIDCGEGAQLSMRRSKLKFSRLGHIFISHLHGDHCFGLPGLISTMSLLKCTQTLHIYLPQEGVEWLQSTLDFFCRERSVNVVIHGITPRRAVLLDNDAITVSSFRLFHRVPTVGFRIDEKPKLRHINPDAVAHWQVPTYALNSLRQGLDWTTPTGEVIPNAELTTDAEASHSYAYCSDTKYSPLVARAVAGVDWIYHEATYGDENEVKARMRGHSTARQAAMTARAAAAHELILGHYSKRYLDETPLLTQAQEIFPNTRLATEGLVIDLNTPRQ